MQEYQLRHNKMNRAEPVPPSKTFRQGKSQIEPSLPRYSILMTKTASHMGNGSQARSYAIHLKPLSAFGSLLTNQSILSLQRQLGNRCVQQVLELRMKASSETDVHPYLEKTIQSARGTGQQLDNGVRERMESSFGADFSTVRIHTDSRADFLNQKLNSHAFTTGRDIFFRQGNYTPGTSAGRELLAHELTHVVQQNKDEIQSKLTVGQPGDRYEQEADAAARAVIRQEQET